MKIHELKTDPEHFSQLVNNNKTCEIRLDDRRFKCGDYLILRQTQYNHDDMSAGKPLKYTGKFILAKITHKFDDLSLGLRNGWCVLSLKILDISDWE